MNFFRWICDHYSVRKLSALVTYYHQLCQLYTMWQKGQRLNRLVQRQIYNVSGPLRNKFGSRLISGKFICSTLKEEYELDERVSRKALLDEEDFKQVLRCHWVTDTNTYPHERQRVQMATLLLLAAYTGSRPSALLSITYKDLDLFVQRDTKTNEVTLMLTVELTKTKGGKGKKDPFVALLY